MPVLGVVGVLCVDIVTVVQAFPKPEEKVLGQSVNFYDGGNAGNVASAVAKLQQETNGLLEITPVDIRMISKVGPDFFGERIITNLKKEGIDCKSVVKAPEGDSIVCVVLVSKDDNSRTCIGTRSPFPLLASEVDLSRIMKFNLLFIDSRFPDAAVACAKYALENNIPVFLDLEKIRPGMQEMLDCCSYLNMPKHFPSQYTLNESILESMNVILDKHHHMTWCTVTLGIRGQICMKRATIDASQQVLPCVNSIEDIEQIHGTGTGVVKCAYKNYQVYFCPGLPISNVVDTTGCGDQYVSVFLLGILQSWSIEQIMRLGSIAAALKTQKLGARTAQPTLAQVLAYQATL